MKIDVSTGRREKNEQVTTVQDNFDQVEVFCNDVFTEKKGSRRDPRGILERFGRIEKKGSRGDPRGILDLAEERRINRSVLFKTPFIKLTYSAVMSPQKRNAPKEIPEEYWKDLGEEKRMNRSVPFKTPLMKLRYSAMMSSQKRKALEEIPEEHWKDLAEERRIDRLVLFKTPLI